MVRFDPSQHARLAVEVCIPSLILVLGLLTVGYVICGGEAIYVPCAHPEGTLFTGAQSVVGLLGIVNKVGLGVVDGTVILFFVGLFRVHFHLLHFFSDNAG